MPTTINREVEKQNALVCAQTIQAFLECVDEVQETIRDMMTIANDPASDDDERAMAIVTIHEALFPEYTPDGVLGSDLAADDIQPRIAPPEVAALLDEMDSEEAGFADRVRTFMGQKQLTQAMLAERAGVTQSAVSALLSRGCRPQRATIVKLAEALGVRPEELWPGFDSAGGGIDM